MIKKLTIGNTRLPAGWCSEKLDTLCDVEYGTRVVRKRDGGTIYPVYGGGGATFFMDTFNRKDCLVVARFAMSAKCTRFIKGEFFLNDSGLSVKPKNTDEISQDFLNLQFLHLNDYIYSLARGTAQKNLNVPVFRKLEIHYPKSLLKQKQIVAILDKAFAAIDTAKTNAEQNLQNAKELFESYLQNVFENKGADWVENTLGKVTSKIGSGATPRGGKANYKEEGISLIRSMNVHDFYFKKKNLA
ncbi:restriction endonuclease subunit S, partial [Flavobacteriaceae bacterium]|nr:restriction endonuclease subunit S [Flavobacteriaceae bacterium]